MFESFRELTEEELERLYDKIREFQKQERAWEAFLRTLPPGNILTHRWPEFGAYRTWMLRDGYYSFKNEYGTRFARKIARDILEGS